MNLKLLGFLTAGAAFILLLYSMISLIVMIYEDHKEKGASIKDCILNNTNFEYFMVNIVIIFVFILSMYITSETEYQRTTVFNIQINNDNTLYKYKVIKYDEIEYRIKRLNGEWKENSQRFEKTRPKVIYTDDVSDFS